jgi:hypothetical protein
MADNEKEIIKPVFLTYESERYELDFNRDSVRFAEQREFILDEVLKYPVSKVPEFFFYAFRWHHKNLSRDKTDKILEAMGGLTPKLTQRLLLLYQQAQMANNLQEDEELEKNGAVTVEMD